MATKVFFDTEFTGLHKLSTLISIALVSEDGREYYAELTDYDDHQVNTWLRENVISNLILDNYNFESDYNINDESVKVKGNIDIVKGTLQTWLEQFKDSGVELWGDVLSDDYLHFRSIFGNAWDIPEYVSYIPHDLSTALKLCRQDPNVNRAEFVYGSKEAVPASDLKTHNALHDARIQKEVYKKIFELLNNAGNTSLVEEAVEVDETKNNEDIKKQTAITKNDGFVEPTQDMVNEDGQEFNPDI